MNLRRKRKLLMSDIKWRGYLHTVSGNPVILYKALSISNINLYGNSAQDGIQSPDNHKICIDVSGTNLFDAANHPDITTGGYIDPNGNCVGKPLYVPVVAGKTYTISKRNKSIHGYDFYYRAIRFEDDNGNLIRADTRFLTNGTIFVGGTGTYSPQYFSSATFTVPDGATILRIGCLPYNTTALQSLCDDLILNVGTVALDYESYIEPQTLNIYTPQQLVTGEKITLDIDKKKSELIADNITDISSLQDWSQFDVMSGTMILSNTDTPPLSQIDAVYYNYERGE